MLELLYVNTEVKQVRKLLWMMELGFISLKKGITDKEERLDFELWCWIGIAGLSMNTALYVYMQWEVIEINVEIYVYTC
jgi:hypothetical protein